MVKTWISWLQLVSQVKFIWVLFLPSAYEPRKSLGSRGDSPKRSCTEVRSIEHRLGCWDQGKISLDFFRVLKVTSILELMQRQAGSIIGPIQSHRLATKEAFATSVGISKTGYKDPIEELCYLKDDWIVVLHDPNASVFSSAVAITYVSCAGWHWKLQGVCAESHGRGASSEVRHPAVADPGGPPTGEGEIEARDQIASLDASTVGTEPGTRSLWWTIPGTYCDAGICQEREACRESHWVSNSGDV